jgi:hypothetical protein
MISERLCDLIEEQNDLLQRQLRFTEQVARAVTAADPASARALEEGFREVAAALKANGVLLAALTDEAGAVNARLESVEASVRAVHGMVAEFVR